MTRLQATLSFPTMQDMIRTGVLLLALVGSMDAMAVNCSVINSPAMLSGKLMVVGSAAKAGRHLHGNSMRAQFAFKCNADTTYNLQIIDGTTGSTQTMVLQDNNGNKVNTSIKLSSIDAKPINLDFNKLPLSGYADRALGGKIYQVLLEVTPIDTAVTNGPGITKNFNGNFKISLQY